MLGLFLACVFGRSLPRGLFYSLHALNFATIIWTAVSYTSDEVKKPVARQDYDDDAIGTAPSLPTNEELVHTISR